MKRLRVIGLAIPLILWFGALWFVFSSHLHYFSPQKITFYSEEVGDDLGLIYCDHLKMAKKTLLLSSFGVTDRSALKILAGKREEGVDVEIINDPSMGGKSREGLKGIRHQKALVVDNEIIFLGSTNCTFPSLTIHGNQLIALRDGEVIKAFKEKRDLIREDLIFYSLPESGKLALQQLISEIDEAKEAILVAMYTLTHNKIIDALIRARERGIAIICYIDQKMAQGTCRKGVQRLLAGGIDVRYRAKEGLLHHKCALIDHHFVFGSANWSKSAFSRNEENLVILRKMDETFRERINLFFRSMYLISLPIEEGFFD